MVNHFLLSLITLIRKVVQYNLYVKHFQLLLILLFSFICAVHSTSCNNFPKILGGTSGNTVLNQIDVYSDYLAMAGHTLDTALTG